ncbi:unnamed protein product, partial [Iphiclides podalirius]
MRRTLGHCGSLPTPGIGGVLQRVVNFCGVKPPRPKLNKTDTNVVGGCIREVLVVVAVLIIRPSDVELDVAEAKLLAAKAEKFGHKNGGRRKVDNAGVVVQTTTAEGAKRLRNGNRIPSNEPTLRVEVSKTKPSHACLRNLDANLEPSGIPMALHDQNFKGSDWTAEKIQNQCRVFKRRGFEGSTTAILEWQVVEETDFIAVNCSNKCQQYCPSRVYIQ